MPEAARFPVMLYGHECAIRARVYVEIAPDVVVRVPVEFERDMSGRTILVVGLEPALNHISHLRSEGKLRSKFE